MDRVGAPGVSVSTNMLMRRDLSDQPGLQSLLWIEISSSQSAVTQQRIGILSRCLTNNSCRTPLQRGQTIGVCSLGGVGQGSLTLSTSCTSRIRRLALPCSRPKSRTRLNRLGKTCRSKRQRNSAPGRDWIISWPVLSLIRKVMIPWQFVIDKAGAPLTPGDFTVEGYRLRRTVDLPYLIRNAKYRVYVLTTNMEYVNERLLEPIKYALDLNIYKHPDSNEPLNKSFKVDILTMDPESIVTNARAKQLSVNVAKFRDILRESLNSIIKLSSEYPNNVEIATYVSLPTLIMFVIDDMIVCSVPFPSQQSRLVPHFVIAHDDVTIQQFISYFFSVKSQAGREILL